MLLMTPPLQVQNENVLVLHAPSRTIISKPVDYFSAARTAHPPRERLHGCSFDLGGKGPAYSGGERQLIRDIYK